MSTPSRQGHFITVVCAHPRHRGERRWIVTRFMAVSYTHLTLPTKA